MKYLMLTTSIFVVGCTSSNLEVCNYDLPLEKYEQYEECRDERRVPDINSDGCNVGNRFLNGTDCGGDSVEDGDSSDDSPDNPDPDDPSEDGVDKGPQGNNGWGNGDQSAPGNSRDSNNAENSNSSQRNHGNGNRN